jgi:hypothetical protein
MRHSTHSDNNFKQVMNRCIFVVALLSAVNVYADSSLISAGKSMQAGSANARTTGSSHTVKWKNSTKKTTTVSQPASRKVFKDDYQRLMRTVAQPRPTRMVWLGQKSRTHRPQLPKTTWLGPKKGSD